MINFTWQAYVWDSRKPPEYARWDEVGTVASSPNETLRDGMALGLLKHLPPGHYVGFLHRYTKQWLYAGLSQNGLFWRV